MRRLFRILLNALTVLSLLLCVATVALWARSYWVADHIWREHGRHDVSFYSTNGLLSLYCLKYSPKYRVDVPLNWAWERSDASTDPNPGRRFAKLANFKASWDDEVFFQHGGVTVPHWSIGVACALLPSTRLIIPRICRRLRRSKGRCLQCGYDLRATPDRCPECGKVPVA